MKKGKKAVSVIIAVTMLITMWTGTVANAKSDMDTVMFDLQSLKIMVGDENGELGLETATTRRPR